MDENMGTIKKIYLIKWDYLRFDERKPEEMADFLKSTFYTWNRKSNPDGEWEFETPEGDSITMRVIPGWYVVNNRNLRIKARGKYQLLSPEEFEKFGKEPMDGKEFEEENPKSE